MKLRESGMPEETYWESLFDIASILDQLRIDAQLKDAAELGCGYGTFTIPIARRISGTLSAFDVDAEMVGRTRRRADEAGLRNVVCEVRDVFNSGFGMRDASQDACLLFNILHGEEPLRLLGEAARILRPGGVALVIHWRHDPGTPRGPAMEIRPRAEQIAAWAGETGKLEPAGPPVNLPPWHFGLRLRRIAE